MCLNKHSKNVSGYWSVTEKWRTLLKFNDVGGWILYTTTNKGKNNKIRGKFEVDGKVKDVLKVGAEEKEVPLTTRVLMQSCRFLHDPQKK